MAVKITESAAREIHSIIKQQELDPDKVRLRVGVKGGGCSGFSYILDLTETQRDSDELWEYHYVLDGGGKSAREIPSDASANGEAASANGTAVATAEGERFTIRVICDPKSYLYLPGTVVDFKDEIMGRGFVFNNPNASSSCGCGSSFSA